MGRNLITKIKSYFIHNWEIRIGHVYREVNLCVDALARSEVNLLIVMCNFDLCPNFINHLLESDLLGIFVPRLIPL